MSDNAEATSVIAAAREYLARGWQPVPIPAREKKPIVKGWPALRLREEDLVHRFRENDNIGLILGEPSGWLVNVDLDCDDARRLADDYLPPTPARTGRPSVPDTHRWYVTEGTVTKQFRDPVTNEMIVELRATGAQTVVGPSVHPDGEAYDVLRGEPARVPAPMLVACVRSLAEEIVRRRHGEQLKPRQPSCDSAPRSYAGQCDLDIEARAIAYLDAMPPAISKQGGHKTTFAAATALVHGFGIEPDRALQLLLQHYNPRCQPPWSERELQHKVNDAATKPHDRRFGWLREADNSPAIPDADISHLIAATKLRQITKAQPVVAAELEKPENGSPADPGLTPHELLRVPGFVSEVMDHCLQTAPYPNTVLAFCGALALQAFLAGRKVCDQADNRTNIYLLGLAYSAVGKDWPRKINTRILHHVGLAGCLGDGFASGEGIQDLMLVRPRMLFQTDEIDGLLQQINRAKDARHEAILSTLLRMYSASNSVFSMRPKANGTRPKTTASAPDAIDQPCLVIFGTAIPNHYYQALSERLLTNGFFARTITLESGPRSPGQEPRVEPLPPRVLESAKWWEDFRPGTGNLEDEHPQPAVVEYTPEAMQWFIDSRKECEYQYAAAESRGDPVGTTVWGRVNEQSRKLALLYAVSENRTAPKISLTAAQWATQFVGHQAQRMLFMAQGHVADNPFHADCLRLMQKLRGAPEQTLPHSVLLKRMKLEAQIFQKIIQTLTLQGDIEPAPVQTGGRTGLAYRLAQEVNEG